MTKATRYARTSAIAAVAAALTLTSTPIFAQQAQPVTAEPATTSPAPADQPAPAPSVSDPAPPAQDTQTAPAAAVTTSDTAPASSAKTKAAKAKPASSAKRAQVAPRPVKHIVAAAPAHAPAAAAEAPAAAPAMPVAANAVTAAPKPAAPAAAAKPASRNSDTELELGGGLLALLAIGGGAVALSRRRRRDEPDEEWYDDGVSSEAAPVDAAPETPAVPRQERELVSDQPAIIAPPVSAFAWGRHADEPMDRHTANNDDRRPGETWVERAYRGPSANNPSLSLRKRLKRAAFFDKRELAAAEGRAEPVAADAGLPANATADSDERVAA